MPRPARVHGAGGRPRADCQPGRHRDRAESCPAAQLKKHRGAHAIPGDYYGPFASAWAVNRTLNTLQKAFLLRSCSDSVYESRTRPCMLHQIRRCAAPCTGTPTSTPDFAEPPGRGARTITATLPTPRISKRST